MVRSRTILSHVAPESFEPGACRALRTLGYAIVAAGEQPAAPELQIVNEESLERIAREASPPVPIVVLTRDSAPAAAFPRVVDSLRRPAPFQDLYLALQDALESTPRQIPRVSTARPARCSSSGEVCIGLVVSLSKRGCCFRSYERLPAGPETNVLFWLPRRQMVGMRARTIYRRGNDVGLVFLDSRPDVRSIIAGYVMDELLAE